MKASAWRRGWVLAVFFCISSLSVSRGDVVISEIMYNPLQGGDFEYVELTNDSAAPVDLTGHFHRRRFALRCRTNRTLFGFPRRTTTRWGGAR